MKYSVIGDNTQENREWLEKVWYTPIGNVVKDLLITIFDDEHEFGFYHNAELEDVHHEFYKGTINCIGNSPLFKAVSAMRDDSDYMQWFINIPQGEYSTDYKSLILNKDTHSWGLSKIAWRKATLTELQERFKEKER